MECVIVSANHQLRSQFAQHLSKAPSPAGQATFVASLRNEAEPDLRDHHHRIITRETACLDLVTALSCHRVRQYSDT
jgi:hypothetical protein